MKITDSQDIKGFLTIQKYTPDDRLVAEVKANNSIVLSGRELVAKLFIAQQIKPISYAALGTGVNPVQFGETKLNNEIFKKNINEPQLEDLQMIEVETEKGEKIPRARIRITADLDPEESNGALTEAGLFNPDGVMYNRVIFPVINKTKEFKLTLIWEILF